MAESFPLAFLNRVSTVGRCLPKLIVAATAMLGGEQFVRSASGATASAEQSQRTPGRFGAGWNAAEGGVYAEADSRWGTPPLTVEMWAKVGDARDAQLDGDQQHM